MSDLPTGSSSRYRDFLALHNQHVSPKRAGRSHFSLSRFSPFFWKRLKGEKKRYYYLILGAILIVFLPLAVESIFNATQAKAAWYDDNWLYRKAINLTTQSNSSDLTNVDTPIVIDTSSISSKLQSNCQDLRFTNQSGKLLPYWLVSGCGTSTTKVYVKLDLVPKNTISMTIYMYYGNATAATGSNSAKFPLLQNLAAYWSMNETSWTNNCSTKSVKDHTANGNDGISCPNTSGPTGGASGKYGNAGSFDGSNDYVDVGNGSSLNLPNQYSFSVWINPTSTSLDANYHTIVGNFDQASSSEQYEIGIQNGKFYICWSPGANAFEEWDTTTTPFTAGTWYNVVATNDGNHHVAIYVNGVSQSLTSNGGQLNIASSNFSNTQIGADTFFSTYFAGSIDELRMYSSVLSASDAVNLANSPASVVIGTPTFASEETSNGPAAYWKFDDAYGTTASDSTSGGHAGTLTGSTLPTWQTEDMCVSGKCLYFSGTTSYVDVPSSSALQPTTNLTVSSWVRDNDSSCGNAAIAVLGNYYGIALSGGKPQLFYYNGSAFQLVTSATTICDGKWHFVSGVKDGTNGKLLLYVDGVLVATNAIGTNIAYTGQGGTTFNVGYNPNTSTGQFTGFIDGVKVYPYARSSAQVLADYNARGNEKGANSSVQSSLNNPSAFSNGLVGYWKMDEQSWNGTSGEVTDSSGNGNNGTFNGQSGTTGTAANCGCSATTITVSGTPFTAGALVNFKVQMTSGTDAWQNSFITANTSNTITLSPAFNGSVANGDTFNISDMGPGKFNSGGTFNGVNSYVQTNTVSGEPTKDYTYAMWIYPTNVSTQQWIISMGDQPDVVLNNGGTISVWDSGNGANITSTTALTANKWYHIVATRSGSTLHIYINGVQDASTGTDGTVLAGNCVLVIGADISNCVSGGSAGQNYAGKIDELRIYNRALSAADVSNLYNFAPGPVAYYSFDEGTGNSVNDRSGNNNTGTWNGTGNYYVAGKAGKAGNFNGTNDYINIPRNTGLEPKYGITLSAWAYITSSVATQYVDIVRKSIGSGDGYILRWSKGDGTLHFKIDRFSSNTSFDVSDTQGTSNYLNAWHYFTATYDEASGVATLYVDGVAHSTITGLSGDIAHTSSDISLMSSQPDNTYIPGKLDEVKIYNYARTQKQILQDMNTGASVLATTGTTRSGSVGYWRFDEGYGSTVHNVGYEGGLDGTWNGTLGSQWTKAGKFNGAGNFNGTDTYVTAGTVNLSGSAITLSAWVNASTFNAINQVVGEENYGRAAFLRVGDSGLGSTIPQFVLGDGTTQYKVSASSGLQTNTWYHLIGTYDGSTMRLYVNGQLAGSATAFSGNFTADDEFDIGRSVNSGRYFSGKIDEVKLYSYALSSDEVKREYNGGKVLQLGSLGTTSDGKTPSNSSDRSYCVPGDTSTCSAPVGDWEFEEGYGTTVNDSSGNGVTGTWHGPGGYYTQGKIGKAGNFHGDVGDTYVQTTGLTDASTGDFTIGLWVKMRSFTNQAGNYPILFASSGNTYVGINNNGTVKFSIEGSNSFSSATVLQTNTWYYIIAERSSNVGKIYINSVQDANTLSDANAVSFSGCYVILGDDGSGCTFAAGSGYSVNGMLDQVRLYNYARTPAQIAWDYNRGGPVAWWKMDDCQGTTINDSSGNGNTGTLNLGASGVTSPGTCFDGTGTTAWSKGNPGKFNYAMNFDGTDDNISVANNIANIQGVSFWANPTSTTTNLLGLSGSAYITASSGTVSATGFSSPSIYVNGVLNGKISANTWNHIVVTTGTSITGSAITIGKANTSYFTGLLDDVRLFTYPPTSLQVGLLYNQGAAVRYGPVTGAP